MRRPRVEWGGGGRLCQFLGGGGRREAWAAGPPRSVTRNAGELLLFKFDMFQTRPRGGRGLIFWIRPCSGRMAWTELWLSPRPGPQQEGVGGAGVTARG